MVKKYYTKKCDIYAVQFTRSNIKEVVDFTGGNAFGFNEVGNVYYCTISTLEGFMRATENDYIIRGLLGEYYPCKPQAFELKYGLIEECDDNESAI